MIEPNVLHICAVADLDVETFGLRWTSRKALNFD